MAEPETQSSAFQTAFNAKAAPVHSFTEVAEHEPQTPAPAQFAPNEKADVVIVGGGYTGLSAALHLAQMAKARGETLNIVLLEAGKVGSAASGKSGGHVGPGFQEHDEAAVVKMFNTPEHGKRALALANEGPALVEKIINDHQIDCDVRRGYVVLSRGTQITVPPEAGYFGIEPYPFVLGMAKAARELGVKIYEDTPVKDIVDGKDGVEVKTVRGSIQAKDMLCAGGHAMAENIPFLRPLHSRTLELLATTIVTDPLPPEVIKAVLPGAGGNRTAFSTDDIDVSYGTVDRHGRIIFGAKVGALKTNPDRIANKLFTLLPGLKTSFKEAAGHDLHYQTLVSNEKLSLTTDMLPNVGRLGEGGHVRYVHGLGGHGIALGAQLGKVAAEDIYGSRTNNPDMQKDFSLFTEVKHMWFPGWQPLRIGLAYAAAETVMAIGKVKQAVQRWAGKKPVV